jgi:hypothetical protein
MPLPFCVYPGEGRTKRSLADMDNDGRCTVRHAPCAVQSIPHTEHGVRSTERSGGGP